jgi:hypothetical protein
LGLLGVKPVQDNCTNWLTRLEAWLTVTVLALGNGLPVAGSYICGPVHVSCPVFATLQ